MTKGYPTAGPHVLDKRSRPLPIHAASSSKHRPCSHRLIPIRSTRMKDLVLAAKALADPTRVRVLAALRDGELCVCELSDVLDVTQSTLSTHLQVIRDANLVQTRKEGKWVYYALNTDTRRLLKGMFGFFADELADAPLLRRDEARLKKRLAEREDGACCRGFS